MTSLTRVALIWIPDRINVWLRFGRPMWEDVPDECRRHVYFPPGAVFGRMEWRADAHSAVRARLAVLRAAEPGERIACLEGITPGAQLLLHATTSGKTTQVLDLIESIEAQRIAPEEVSEDYWRVLHQRLVAGITPPLYSAAEHAAAQRRRALLP
jgi:hypothetical protein